MGNIFYLPYEIDFILWLQAIGHNSIWQNVLISFFNTASFFGEQLIAIIILGVIYWGIDKEKGKRLGLMLVCVNIVYPLIKNIVKRSRPWFSNENIKNLRDVEGYSFPSGHSCNASGIYSSLALMFKKKCLTVIAFILPLLVALSRNYLGAHYLSDVIVGLVIGYLLAFIINKYYDKLKSNKAAVIILLISATGLFYCTSSDYFSSLGMLIGYILAVNFEDKITKFQNTDKWYLIILRTVVGGGIYLLLDKAIKWLFALVKVSSYAEMLLRSLRYTIIIFVLFALYPLIFKPIEKIIKK